MTRRRTAAPQKRATDAALQRRVGESSGPRLSGTAMAIIGTGVLVVVGLSAILVLSLLAPGASEVVGEQQAFDGDEHITAGTRGSGYSSNPAASGQHWGNPLNWGVYPDPIPQEPAIHNLEHGGIVIWYQAGEVSAEQIAQLETYTRQWNASERFKVLVAPWAGDDFGHPIAAVAWRWLLYQDDVDTALLDQFIDQHYGDSPEPGGGPGPPAQ